MQYWKSFTIADIVTFIKVAMNELKPETIYDCWKSLWNQVMSDFKGLHGTDGEVKKNPSHSKINKWIRTSQSI